ncbi:MAG: hypothetical protein WA667_13730 [Candidatus Nitrosopolaris sp.]
MKDPYHCPYCDQRSTRRWNLEVHIKRKHGGSPGPYLASHPFWYKPTNPYHNIESTTVAENGGSSFQPRYIPQQAPLATSQYSASPMYSHRQTIDDQSYATSLSDTTTTKLKIEELKRLVYKYSQYHNNDPDEIVRLVVYYCINGDNTLLDNKLEQLRAIERRLNGWS